MPLNEVSFYNTNGDEITLTNLVTQMINFYKMKLEVGETAITDFNEGSEIRNILEVFAVLEYARLEEEHENTRIAFINSSYGQWLDRIGELPFIDLARVVGEYAEGSVTFTLAIPQETDYTIPAGTIVTDSTTGLDFATVTEANILSGETTVTTLVECLTTGTDGNILAGNIDECELDQELISVTNADDFYGGADYEDDESYRQRLLADVQAPGFGSLPYYVELCEAVDGVHDVLFIEDTDNIDPKYTRIVLVNGDVKETPSSVLLEVLMELTIIDNRVVGHNFTVDKPSYSEHELVINLDVATELDENDLKDCLTAFCDGGAFDRIEYTGLNIGESLTKDMIVSCLSVFPDIIEVTSVKENNVEITSLDPGVEGVLKLDSLTFNQTEV